MNSKSIFSYVFFLLSCLTLQSLSAQGIKGTVKTSKGESLPYASIYIPKINIGASTNLNGEFEVKLPPGKHVVMVQYVGYEKIESSIEISDAWLTRDFVLKDVSLFLDEVTIRSRREDPAYTIMRKAVAKRKYHLLQYNSYEATVYIKGTGELQKVPFFLKKKIEKEAEVKLNEAYTSESVSHIRFEQPDKIEEKVISVYSTGNNTGSPAPSIFIHQRIYQEKVANVISPLAPSAFSYYKFEYEGSFREGNIEVNKIKVIPRSRGEQVFEGHIYIIENLWAVHSLEFETILMGFRIKVEQNFAEVAPKVWMPITHQYHFYGKVWGFVGEYRYLASLSDYQVKLNPDLTYDTEIIDEKIQKVPKEVEAVAPEKVDKISEVLANEDKLTRKQFRKLMNQYEKESLEQVEEPEVVSERAYEVDSLAHKRDSAYWETIRPVPLTLKEQRGYYRDDSLARTAKTLPSTDTISSRKRRKKESDLFLKDIFLGRNYELSRTVHFTLDPTLAQVYFNTVEGLNLNMSGSLKFDLDSSRQSLIFSPHFRYGFSSKDLYVKGKIAYTTNKPQGYFLEGGRFVEQFNDEEPVHPHINTLSTLFFRRNFMKIYEMLYAKAGYSYEPSVWFSVKGSLEWARRSELFNENDYSFFYRDTRTFTPNQLNNTELPSTSFPGMRPLFWPCMPATSRWFVIAKMTGTRFLLTTDHQNCCSCTARVFQEFWIVMWTLTIWSWESITSWDGV